MADWYVVYKDKNGSVRRTTVEASSEDEAKKKFLAQAGVVSYMPACSEILKIEPM